MKTDADLSAFAGATLLNVEVREGPELEEDEYGAHETQFLNVVTDRGVLDCVTHNEHNGYYGGFSVVARVK